VTLQDTTGARRWIVLATIFLNLALLYGLWYSYSVFLVALLREFHWSRSVIAGGFSAFVLINGAVSPVVGWMTGRHGGKRIILCGAAVLGVGLCLAAHVSQWWELYITFGIIASAGLTSAGWLPSIILVRGWFLNRVGMAVGIVSAGIGVGITVIVPLTQFLIDRVGWRWTYRLFALAIVGWVIPATYALVRDPAPEVARRAEPAAPRATVRSWTLGQAVRDRRYWLLGAMYFLGNMVTQLLFVHQVAFLVDHGMVPLMAASVGGVAGFASIVGKIGWGSLSDRTGREISYTWALLCLAGSLGVLVLAGNYPGSALPYVYAVLFGLGYAGTAVLIPAATSDLFAGPGFASIFGSLQAVLAVGAALGAWAAGKTFDLTGSYGFALWLAFAVSLASPALMWLAAPSRSYRAGPPIER
jgi:MFS family permease